MEEDAMRIDRVSHFWLFVGLLVSFVTSSSIAAEFECAHVNAILIYTTDEELDVDDALEFVSCTILSLSPTHCNQTMTHKYFMGRPSSCGSCLDTNDIYVYGDSDIVDSFEQYDNFVVREVLGSGCYLIACCGEQCVSGDEIDCD
jgi:hypothetical protein